MIKLNGKYNSAKIFTDVVDDESVSQVMLLLNQEFVKGNKIRMMPDIHAGAGCTIGTTMTITDKIIPNLVGVDIGCGVEVARIREKDVDLKKLDEAIYEKIPSGHNIRETVHPYFEQAGIESLFCYQHINTDRAAKSLGTLGGGNHYLEADKSDSGDLYIVVHSGSRHLGLQVANYYQDEAYKSLTKPSKAEVDAVIKALKAEGRQKDIQKTITSMQKTTKIPKQLAYVEGELFDCYIHDMKIVQKYAMLNRKAMMDELMKTMGFHVEEVFTTIHNYIDTDHMILRKGAVSAAKGEKLIIPINMRDGALICTGKGNNDWNQSAPHGAGRLMSRSQAKQALTVSEFEASMAGIYTTSVGQETIDEAPMAYKSINDIIDNIGDTVDIVQIVKPVYNFKAGC